jgi:hypothetical protein
MKVSISISPINSLIFVHGSPDWTPPIPIRDKLIWLTSSCIATACFPEVDGSTEVTMGDSREVDPHIAPVFEAQLETPQRRVDITTVGDDNPVLSMAVTDERTPVRIWHSHPRWPERVTIGLG